MGAERSSYRMLGGLSKGLSRILIILRTRKIYGYNSVFERIFRCLFNTRKKRKQPFLFDRQETIIVKLINSFVLKRGKNG